jgi:hypothetical protein
MAKADFSMGDALGAGFRLLRRQTPAVLGWGALYVMVAVASWALLLPMLKDMPWPTAGTAVSTEATEAYLQSMYGFQAAANLLNLAGLVVGLLVWTAAMRATLNPGRSDRFLFLRVGMDELRVLVVSAAVFAGLYAFVLFVVLLGLGLGFALHAAAGQTATVVAVSLFPLLALIVLLIGWSRLSLLAPMSVITGRFAFAEGWKAGKGRTAKLVGLNLLIFLIYYLVSVATVVVIGGVLVVGFFATGGVWPRNPGSFNDIIAAVRPMAPWAALAMLPFVVLTGWCVAFWAGALTTAARQLADGVADA